MSSLQILGAMVGLVAAFSAVVVVAMRVIANGTSKALSERLADHKEGIDHRIRAVERRVDEQGKDLSDLKADLPVNYVRRDDWLAFRDEWLKSNAIQEQKLDKLRALIDSIKDRLK